MRARLFAALIVLCLPTACHAQGIKERALKINQKEFVFDAHCDTVIRLMKKGTDLGIRSKDGHIDIPRMLEGGLNAQVFAMWVEPQYYQGGAARRLMEMMDCLHTALDKYPEKIGLVLKGSDFNRLFDEKKIAVILGIEGGHPIEDSLATLRMYHRLGVRLMTLTWMRNTNWADAAGDKTNHNGLTDFGKRVVREMNRLKMVIDVSHVSDKTFFDVMEITTQPVVASHSCARSVCNHFRNLSDDMLKALAKNGGVVGINYLTAFLDPEVSVKMQAVWQQYDAFRKKYPEQPEKQKRARHELWDKVKGDIPSVPVSRIVDHIDHIVKVAGIDHVGLGSDFDGISQSPEGLDDVSKIPLITEALLERGYLEADIIKILGGNLLRVFEQVLGE